MRTKPTVAAVLALALWAAPGTLDAQGGSEEERAQAAASPLAPLRRGRDAFMEARDFSAALGPAELEAEEIAILGRKSGVLTAALKRVATLPVEERKRFGAAVNREDFEEAEVDGLSWEES